MPVEMIGWIAPRVSSELIPPSGPPFDAKVIAETATHVMVMYGGSAMEYGPAAEIFMEQRSDSEFDGRTCGPAR